MKKKIITIVIVAILAIGIGSGLYIYFNKQDKNTLTILEKEWIQGNKNNILDMSMLTNYPVFNYEGEGLIYDFLNTLEKDTELEFNKIPYNENEKTDYYFNLTKKIDKNDILIYDDNYVLVTNERVKYNNFDDIKEMNVGVLKEDIEEASLYLNNNISFTEYESVDEMITDVKSETKKINGIILLKTKNMEDIIKNDLTISYSIDDMKKSLVLHLGSNKKLNNILKKYYKKWSKENYMKNFSEHFSSNYYEFLNVDDDTKVKFKSKRYEYGFVSNEPYDKLIDHRLVGYNSEVIKEFSKMSEIEVAFHEYKSYADLIKAFNENKIDFFLNTTAKEKFDMDTLDTVSIFDEKYVVLSHVDSNNIINSVNSLKDKTVSAISNHQISDYLEKNKIKINKYDNFDKLLQKTDSRTIIISDFNTYIMYQSNELKNYRINYIFNIDNDYRYTLRDIKDNNLFNKYFSFYVSFIGDKSVLNKVSYKTFEEAKKLQFVKPLIYTLFAIVILVILTIVIKKVKKHEDKNNKVSKENKLRYIDMLTSLKNRNYLNDSIEKWDESEIYPQSIVIVDLNNVAYINDNYGHNEGDNVIKEAANILIKNQLENSEIIRTNGNEFLIYLVEHDEKQIVSYIRKLSKEFKELEHGFGAAIGYSMINDGLKTLDDAINEATLDMRTNKEEAQD